MTTQATALRTMLRSQLIAGRVRKTRFSNYRGRFPPRCQGPSTCQWTCWVHGSGLLPCKSEPP